MWGSEYTKAYSLTQCLKDLENTRQEQDYCSLLVRLKKNLFNRVIKTESILRGTYSLKFSVAVSNLSTLAIKSILWNWFGCVALGPYFISALSTSLM